MKKIYYIYIVFLITIAFSFVFIYYYNQYNSVSKIKQLNAICEYQGISLSHELSLNLFNKTIVSKLFDNSSFTIFCFYNDKCASYDKYQGTSCMCNVLGHSNIIATNLCIDEI